MSAYAKSTLLQRLTTPIPLFLGCAVITIPLVGLVHASLEDPPEVLNWVEVW
jgi:hypothetical protein